MDQEAPSAETTDEPSRTPRARSLVAIAMSALWADGRERPAEQIVLSDALTRVPLLAGIGPDGLTALAVEARDRFADEGAHELCRSSADALDEDEQLTAFALAVDVVLADGNVTIEEAEFVEELTGILELDPGDVDQVVAVHEAKHGIDLEASAPEEPANRDAGTPSEAEALLAFAIGAARTRPEGEEQRTPEDLELELPSELRELPPRRRHRLLRTTERELDTEPEAYLRRCADVLDAEGREGAFTWAAEVALSDARLSEPEHAFLTRAREVLGLPPDTAARTVDVLWNKHLR